MLFKNTQRYLWVPAALVIAVGLVAFVASRQRPARPDCVALFAGSPSPLASKELTGLPVEPGSARAALELFNGKPIVTGKVTAVPAGALVSISGWAVDDSTKSAGAAVLAEIDDAPPVRADCYSRSDVAAFFHQPAFAQSGFGVRFLVPQFGARKVHTIKVLVVNSAGSAMRAALPPVHFLVTPRVAPKQRASLVSPAAASARTLYPKVAMDLINGTALGGYVNSSKRLTVRRDHDVLLEGWAALEGGGTRHTAGEVDLLLDGHLVAIASYGAERPDVAGFYSDPGLKYSGFSGRFSLDYEQRGQHELQVSLKDPEGSALLSQDRVLLDVI